MVNRVKLGEQLSVQQLWADGQLERLGPGVDTDRVSVLVAAGSLIRHPANGELREQVLNQVEQRSQLPRVLTLSPHACSLVHVDSLLTPI